MRVLTRYAVKRFLGPFLFALGLFSLLVFLGDLFDKLNKLSASPAPVGVILQYLALQVPYWTIRVVPMGTLLATLFAVTSFVNAGEYVALQAAGVPAKVFFRPLWAVSLVVAALSFAAQESVLPACYGRAQSLWRVKIFPDWEYDRYFGVVLAGGPDRLITATEFSLRAGKMERPVMDYFGPAGVSRQVDARRAHWDAARRRWIFEEGVVRAFLRSGEVGEEPFMTLESDLEIPPAKLEPRPRDPDSMSIAQTIQQLRRTRLTGEPQQPVRMALQAKIAYPFTNLVLCALGIPIALRLRRAGRGPTFVAALAVCFVYLWLIEACGALGKSGALAAPVAAWIPNLGFGSLALWLHGKAEIL